MKKGKILRVKNHIHLLRRPKLPTQKWSKRLKPSCLKKGPFVSAQIIFSKKKSKFLAFRRKKAKVVK